MSADEGSPNAGEGEGGGAPAAGGGGPEPITIRVKDQVSLELDLFRLAGPVLFRPGPFGNCRSCCCCEGYLFM